jgi:hypothetical protein
MCVEIPETNNLLVASLQCIVAASLAMSTLAFGHSMHPHILAQQ